MPSRQRTPIVIAATLALCVAAGVWWFRGHESPGRSLAGVTAAPSNAVAKTSSSLDTDPAASGLPLTTQLAAPSRPLPPDDAPLASVFDELKARADAGDARSACRLAVDLLECGALVHTSAPQLDRLRKREATSDSDGDLTEANRYAEMQAQLLAARQRCARIDADQIALAGDYLHRSAKAGVAEAMLRYASGQGFGSDNTLSALRDPGFDAWRRDAPGMMQASLHDGRPEAVAMLSEAYRSDGTLLFSALIPNNAVQARAYRVLHQRLLGQNAPADTAPIPPDTLAQMTAAGIDTRALNPTPEQIRQADAEADRLYQTYFEGQPLNDSRAMGRWLNVGPRLSTTGDPPVRPRCS